MAHNPDNLKQEGKYFLRKFFSKAKNRETKIGDVKIVWKDVK